jgi:hypothetical protein
MMPRTQRDLRTIRPRYLPARDIILQVHLKIVLRSLLDVAAENLPTGWAGYSKEIHREEKWMHRINIFSDSSEYWMCG